MLSYCTWAFLVTRSTYWYQNICPCDLDHLWNLTLSGAFVFHKRILFYLFLREVYFGEKILCMLTISLAGVTSHQFYSANWKKLHRQKGKSPPLPQNCFLMFEWRTALRNLVVIIVKHIIEYFVLFSVLQSIFLWVSTSNPAQHLYERQGYVTKETTSPFSCCMYCMIGEKVSSQLLTPFEATHSVCVYTYYFNTIKMISKYKWLNEFCVFIVFYSLFDIHTAMLILVSVTESNTTIILSLGASRLSLQISAVACSSISVYAYTVHISVAW